METFSHPFLIGGMPALSIAEKFGTPLYVYDANIIEAQYHRLMSAFSELNFKPKYACKANTNLSILKFILHLGCGLDTVSIQEVKLGILAGFAPDNIIFTPNSVSIDEIVEAAALGVRLNIDNLHILNEFGIRYGNTKPVCIRLNPHIVAGGNIKIQTAHLGSKFGISIHQIDDIIAICQKHEIVIEGLHMHSGSDIKDVNSFLKGLEVLFDTAKYFSQLNYLDFGSGFKVAYKEDDASTDIEQLGKEVCARFNAFCKNYGKTLELWCEPGKYLVSRSGYLLVNVNVLKATAANITIAGVDSGLNHLIRPMMYDAYHEIVNISNPSLEKHPYSVVGNICETDTFGTDRLLSEVRMGDTLAILNAGAYGFSMSSNYNSRLKPAEIMVYKGKAHLIRQRQVFEDLLLHQPQVDFL